MVRFLRMSVEDKTYIIINSNEIEAHKHSEIARQICHPFWGLDASGLVILHVYKNYFDYFKLLSADGTLEDSQNCLYQKVMEKTIRVVTSCRVWEKTEKQDLIDPAFFDSETDLKWDGYFRFE